MLMKMMCGLGFGAKLLVQSSCTFNAGWGAACSCGHYAPMLLLQLVSSIWQHVSNFFWLNPFAKLSKIAKSN